MTLIRTTIYFEEPVLRTAKITAVYKRKPLYKIVNEELKKAFGLTGAKQNGEETVSKKGFHFEDLFIVKDMGLGKRKVKRTWAYE